ncbi:MAG: HD domain-containing protein, partial [Anaerolineae bacterium]|nr:HD domain-containing protein [Anaerolineae bacterium]
MPTSVRLAELLASLSLAIDLGTGQPMEWVMKYGILAVNLSKVMGLNEKQQRDVYYLSLLRHIGCTANAHFDAQRFGDELAVAEGMALDVDSLRDGIGFVFRNAGRTKPPLGRAASIASMMAAGPSGAKMNHHAHCEVAQHLSGRLGFALEMSDYLWQIYERWDGKGDPKGMKGEQIALPARVIHLAQDVVIFYTMGGLDATLKMVKERTRRYFDPAIAESFCKHAGELCDSINVSSVWDATLQVEPGKPTFLSESQMDDTCTVIADFTDMKSPFTLSHSRRVAELAEKAAHQMRLPESDSILLRRAGYIHDVGRVGITASIWGKQGALTESEWERVRLHPYYTERVFSRSKELGPIVRVAALHHERLDGSGYHHQFAGTALPVTARILAAADVYCAMTETRPHRVALETESAVGELRREAKAGRLDPAAVDAILSAAGHVIRSSKPSPSTELSQREIEVIRLIARGHSNKEMARQLS